MMTMKSNPFPRSAHDNILSALKGKEHFAPSLHKWENEVVYEYLETPCVQSELDYFSVMYTLCDAFSDLYRKFNSQIYCNIQDVYEALRKFDTWLKTNFIDVVAHDLTKNIAVKIAREQLNNLEGLADLEVTEPGARGSYGTVQG
jgi:hypothetical protein